MTGAAPPGAAGLVIAAPASGSGKTLVTLGLLRHLAAAGRRVASAKVGPDYIDPAFHAAASGRPCRNLDPWAMAAGTLAAQVAAAAAGAELVVCEGVMGLFDGAVGERGSTADLARRLGWPVVLVVDARAQAASAAALVRGFATHRADLAVAGVVFNRVGGDRHGDILRDAMAADLPHIPVLGCLPRDGDLALPSRHLGLVQALEHPDLETFLDRAAALVGRHLDVDALVALALPTPSTAAAAPPPVPPPLPPLGQRIAVARDAAFAFAYPAVLDGWHRAGAEVLPFAPLDGQAPDPAADAVYLPGGYPELWAGRLAANGAFLAGLAAAAGRGAAVFGECGGYMVLGRGLVDGDGARHAMAGLLALETAFTRPGLRLGYRRARLLAESPLGPAGAAFRGHEFHYATVTAEGPGAPLFACADAAGRDLGTMGLRAGPVLGSFVHLIDRDGA
ncbi:MAG: cobyrinate a,c-diamide synthase [Hyphomicrobiales bacterium]|nr:cobyrinate a,c-diamide synthase [Hyphomicrobiales bacterium]